VIVLDKLTGDGTWRNLAGIAHSPKLSSGTRASSGHSVSRKSSRTDLLELVRGDIRDRELVERLVERVEVVVNFAAESHVDNSLSAPDAFVQSNILGSYEILRACLKFDRRLHHISTDEVFGDLPLPGTETAFASDATAAPRFSETSPYRPSSPYSATKAAADLLIRAWVRSFGLRATISNCSNNYGPYQHIEKFIPRQITNLLSGLPAKLYGSGLNVRDWIHVSDHAAAIFFILERGAIGETYLVGADCELSNREVLAKILRFFGKADDDFETVPDRPGHDLRYAIDWSKLCDQLGWRPLTPNFDSGLVRTIDWYIHHRDFWTEQKAMVEARYGQREHNSGSEVAE
jgi:dTDP-glucose 4,6-dehydratase